MSVGTADENTRLAAIGALNNPSIFDRNAEGLVLSQLITDFGRTANLTGSAKLQAQAEADNAQATREQILLAVDAAFFAAQQAQSVTLRRRADRGHAAVVPGPGQRAGQQQAPIGAGCELSPGSTWTMPSCC